MPVPSRMLGLPYVPLSSRTPAPQMPDALPPATRASRSDVAEPSTDHIAVPLEQSNLVMHIRAELVVHPNGEKSAAVSEADAAQLHKLAQLRADLEACGLGASSSGRASREVIGRGESIAECLDESVAYAERQVFTRKSASTVCHGFDALGEKFIARSMLRRSSISELRLQLRLRLKEQSAAHQILAKARMVYTISAAGMAATAFASSRLLNGIVTQGVATSHSHIPAPSEPDPCNFNISTFFLHNDASTSPFITSRLRAQHAQRQSFDCTARREQAGDEAAPANMVWLATSAPGLGLSLAMLNLAFSSGQHFISARRFDAFARAAEIHELPSSL